MKKIYLIIALLCFTTLSFAQEKPTEEYKNELKSLVIVTGGIDAYQEAINQIVSIMNPNTSSEQLKKINDYVTPKLADLMVDILAPMYIEVGLTIEEIREVKDVYLTESGKKFVEAQKKMLKNTSTIGQQIASKLQVLIKEAGNQ